MKNILIIIPSLKFGGGAEKVSSTIGTELYKDGYNVSYFTFYDFQEKYSFEGNYFSLKEAIQGNLFVKIIKLFTRAYKIANFCKKNKIETSISFMEDANFSTILSKFLGNKSKLNIAIRHSLFEYGKGLYYWLIKLLYRFADTIIVMTKYEKDNLIKRFDIHENKIKLIYNSINSAKIDVLKQENIGNYKDLFDNDKFNFITVGRLNKIKNQKLMIQSFVELNKKYSKTQLLILGEGELENELKRTSDNENIHFLGNQKNVFSFLYKSDCFLLTSFSEAFPNVILEAMVCGLPIISTKTQGGYEILGKDSYGLSTENNNGKVLFETMQKIYLDKNLKNHYKQKSLERIKDFEIGKVIKNWKNIL